MEEPRGNHGELFRAILRFAEHLRGNHRESVWVITPVESFTSLQMTPKCDTPGVR